jgi:Amt family ammonium transporter
MSGTFSGTGLRAALSVIVLLAVGGLALGQSGTEVALSSAASQPAVAEQIDTGATAWMLISSALVMFMVPGLALFYAGMVRRKNVLGTMMHSFGALAVVGVQWVLFGYMFAFGNSDHALGGFIGWDPSKFMLMGISPDSIVRPGGVAIPEYVWVMFQGMFAIITPALIAGAFAERVRFSSYMVFSLLWSVFIYNPLAHMVWGGGCLGVGAGNVGAVDFAGGIVVHISAGASALVMALYLGKRIGTPHEILQPNSLVLTLLGAGMLWFGWFGFNGGSAAAANKSAVLAFTNTQIAAAAGALAWMVAEWFKHGKATSLGVASGLVAGLATVTPASGYVPPHAALLIGAVAGLVCYWAVMLKSKYGYDDSLDAFGVHGVGGFLGALLTGLLAVKAYGGIAGGLPQFQSQLIASLVTAGYAVVITLALTFVIDRMIGFRISENREIEGLDASLHGEQGWILEQSSVQMPGRTASDTLT